MELTLTAGCRIKFCTQQTKLYAPIITILSFIALLTDRYNDRLLPFVLIPNSSNKFMDFIENCSTPCLNQFCQDLNNTWCYVTFYIFNSQLKLKDTWFKTSGSAVCISVCLTSLTPSTFNSWEKQFLHFAIILRASITKSPLLFTMLVLGW